MVRASIEALFVLCVVPVLIAGKAGRAGRSTSCDAGWTRRNPFCYKLVANMRANWPDAQTYCSAVGGVLAAPNNEDEASFLRQMARERGVACPWIGVIDLGGENRWMSTVTKRALTFTDWANGEPNNNFNTSQENCVCMYGALGYRWNDSVCPGQYEFICQKAVN